MKSEPSSVDWFAPHERGDRAGLDLHAYAAIVRRHWILVVLLALLGGLAGYLKYAMTPRLYQAETIIQIQRRSLASRIGNEAGGLEGYIDAEYYPTQFALLRSRGLAEKVVRHLRLDETTAFNRAASRASLEAEGRSGAASDEAALAGLATNLLGGLRVNPIPQTQLVQIQFHSPDPEMAAKVANAFADAYIDWTIESRQSSTSSAAEFLGREIEQLKAAIQEKDRQIKELSKSVNLLPLEGGTDALRVRLESLNESLSAAVRKRIEREARRHELLRASPDTVAEVEASPN
ncbi:MAG TPA: Wzz/FepE/Etk N-terminal domain-containing protein, partial [Thermoanaerobaculia bacterium]|nr:Wzz/FepE/Etk N-terminal domain-containing protein [Thermoanaerobaculia bacterium]